MDTARTHYWSHGVVRQLLRSVRRPAQLEREELALEVKAALRSTTAREALLSLIRDALTGLPEPCRQVIELCDVEGRPTGEAAELLHISVRQLFRYRADAMAAIAGEINRVLSSRRAPAAARDGGAFEVGLGLMLLGRGAQTAYPEAVRCFEAALALDERNAAAHAGLATALLQLAAESMGDVAALHRRARRHARRALELGPHVAASHHAAAEAALATRVDVWSAERHAREALSLSDEARSHYVMWQVMLAAGRLDEARAAIENALRRDASSFASQQAMVRQLMLEGQAVLAAQRCAALLAVEPHSRKTRAHLAESLQLAGQFAG